MKVIVDASRAFAGVYRPAAVARYLRADVAALRAPGKCCGGSAMGWRTLT